MKKLSKFYLIKKVLFFIVFQGFSFSVFSSELRAELRCGWFENASPNNASLSDNEGEWTIAMQGGHQAKGDWPKFTNSQWVNTGVGSYGYGCACLKVITNKEEMEVIEIISGNVKALSVCRQDRALKEPAQ